jgi:putative transposase
MPRRRRYFPENVTVHVHQRGNNRIDMFLDTRDRVQFLMSLLDASRAYGVAIHTWVLMSNHFHLLATPAKRDSVPRMMQQVGRRYVPYFNERSQRTGSLWEGRYRAHLVDSDEYWFRCARYVELNPVRAGIVTAPHEYFWSSYRALGFGAHDDLITPHPLYVALGATSMERQASYRALCGTLLTDPELASIRTALNTGSPRAELLEGALRASAG